jgi:hypothetical protein
VEIGVIVLQKVQILGRRSDLRLYSLQSMPIFAKEFIMAYTNAFFGVYKKIGDNDVENRPVAPEAGATGQVTLTVATGAVAEGSADLSGAGWIFLEGPGGTDDLVAIPYFRVVEA